MRKGAQEKGTGRQVRVFDCAGRAGTHPSADCEETLLMHWMTPIGGSFETSISIAGASSSPLPAPRQPFRIGTTSIERVR